MRFRRLSLGFLATLLVGVIVVPETAAAFACQKPVSRFPGGPGRGSGVIPVPLSIDLRMGEISDITDFRIALRNRSSYDVGHVVVQSSVSGVRSADVFGVTGASYDERRREFFVERVPGEDEAVVDFQVFFPEPLPSEPLQLLARIRDFAVLDRSGRSSRIVRLERREARSRRTHVRVGIGAMDVACFSSQGEIERPADPRTENLVSTRSRKAQRQTLLRMPERRMNRRSDGNVLRGLGWSIGRP